MYKRYCELRDMRGMSDSQVAAACGFKQSTFSDWKKGKSSPKIDKIISIAECLDVSIDYLVTGKEKGDDPEDRFSMMVNKLRLDPSMTDALEKYFNLSDEKKKHIIETINMLCEG